MTELPPTPAPQSTRGRRVRRRARVEEESCSEDEVSPTSVVPAVINFRSHRASKTAAMTKMTAKTTIRIDEYDDSDADEEGDDSEPCD